MDFVSSAMACASMLPPLFIRMARTLRDMALPVDLTPLALKLTLADMPVSMRMVAAVAMAS